MLNTSDILKNAWKSNIAIPPFNVPYLPMVGPVIRAVAVLDSFALIATARLEWLKFASQGLAAVMAEFARFGTIRRTSGCTWIICR